LSQSTNISTFFLGSEKKADELYSTKAYRNALEIYLRIAEKDGANVYAKKQIADCYLRLNDPVSAEFWYKSLATDPDIDPKIKVKLAEVLCMNKKYTEALKVLKTIRKDKNDSSKIEKKIKFIENINYYLRDSLLYTIGNAGTINSVYSDFGAAYFRKSHVVFASTRDHEQFIKHKSLASPNEDEAMTNLFVAKQTIAAGFEEVKLFKNETLHSLYHDGPITFYDNYTKVAFTRTNFVNKDGIEDANGSVNLKIYLGEVGALGGLRNVIPFQHNNDGYSVGHATFTKDGNTMYFSSTHPLGFGGADIYSSTFANGEWSEPVNAGSAINSPGNELYPHLENDSTLFFSSTGFGGFGGLDNFLSKKRNGKFLGAQNLGYSLNSPHDDFALITDSTGRVGFFASNRPGGKGDDDIYRVIIMKTFLQGQTRQRNNTSIIVPHTKITVKDEFGNLIDSVRSDSEGNFYVDLPFEKDLTLSAQKEGYELLEDIGFSTKGLPFGIDSLLLPMWKHGLFAKGRIFSNEAQALLPGATVFRTDLNTNKTNTVVVSENGEYVFLVIPNHKYRIEAKKDEFIPNGFNLDTKDLYDGDLLNDIVLEEVYIEKSVPLFDLNKSNIRPEAFKGLDKIVRTLKKYPTTTLNIGAHADSRGTNAYNKRLSSQRAETVVKYFTDKGVSRKRIEAQAFGEELILNHCSDGVICDEESHSLNRRVEIKVQNKPVE
jgi:outer membrane protein OmpA-like peptidoglycan-associated protein